MPTGREKKILIHDGLRGPGIRINVKAASGLLQQVSYIWCNDTGEETQDLAVCLDPNVHLMKELIKQELGEILGTDKTAVIAEASVIMSKLLLSNPHPGVFR